MFNNIFINFALRHLPREKWNGLSSFCACFSLPTIGSPIKFTHRNFYLEEFATHELASPLLQQFLNFCYPADAPDREQQIDFDRQLYWKDSTTLLAFNSRRDIVGCIQVIPRNNGRRLPVEYAAVVKVGGLKTHFNIRGIIPCDNVTEVYRCRRSFDLNKIEAVNVLLMLFKAVWAKTIQTGTAFSCISFDSSKADLRHMYLHKLAFFDPGISLTFGTDPRCWSFMIKDWNFHEKKYASLSKTHFYL